MPLDPESDVFPIDHRVIAGFDIHIVDLPALLKKSGEESVVLLEAPFPVGSFAVRMTAQVAPTDNYNKERARLYTGAISLRPGIASGEKMVSALSTVPCYRYGVQINNEWKPNGSTRLIESFWGRYPSAIVLKDSTLTVTNECDIEGDHEGIRHLLVPRSIKDTDDAKSQLFGYLGGLLGTARAAHRIGTYQNDFPELRLDDFVITPDGPLFRNPDTGEYVHNLERQTVTIAGGGPQNPEDTTEATAGTAAPAASPFMDRRPETATFDTLHGVEGIRNELASLILFYKHPELAAKWRIARPNNVFLFGPAGTGKSSLVFALGNEIGAEVKPLKGTEIHSMWLGQSEEKIMAVFDSVRDATKPVILFFDELEALINSTDSKGGASSAINAVAGIFKREIIAISVNPNVIIAAATNWPEKIDPTLIREGRFDIKLKVDLPNKTARRAIFENLLRQMSDDTGAFQPFEASLLKSEALDALADLGENLTGAAIVTIMSAAALRKAVIESTTNVATPVSLQDLKAEILAHGGRDAGTVGGMYL